MALITLANPRRKRAKAKRKAKRGKRKARRNPATAGLLLLNPAKKGRAKKGRAKKGGAKKGAKRGAKKGRAKRKPRYVAVRKAKPRIRARRAATLSVAPAGSLMVRRGTSSPGFMFGTRANPKKKRKAKGRKRSAARRNPATGKGLAKLNTRVTRLATRVDHVEKTQRKHGKVMKSVSAAMRRLKSLPSGR